MKYHLDKASQTPLYKQLIAHVEEAVRSGALSPGTIVPSMNELAARENISRETVKKSYAILVRDGYLVPKQGKGFYIADRREGGRLRVLVIFDKLSVYKQVTFNVFAATLGSRADITVLTHNQSPDLLEYYLDTHLDNFDWYVVSPHFALDSQTQQRVRKLMMRIPYNKLIMLDYWLKDIPGNYGAVYQDFENDIYEGLQKGLDRIGPGNRLRVITLPESLYGAHIQKGIARFSQDINIPVQYLTQAPQDISRGDIFLILNSQLDWGLAALARIIATRELTIGKDVCIISYNDFALNEVVLGGLTTVSTDFAQMGRLAADMILSGQPRKIHCNFILNRRSTF